MNRESDIRTEREIEQEDREIAKRSRLGERERDTTGNRSYSEDTTLLSLKRTRDRKLVWEPYSEISHYRVNRENYSRNILAPKFWCQSYNPIVKTIVLAIGFGGLICRQNFGKFWRKFGKPTARISVLAIGLMAQLVSHGETLGGLVKQCV